MASIRFCLARVEEGRRKEGRRERDRERDQEEEGEDEDESDEEGAGKTDRDGVSESEGRIG